jgi:hypothetical protein
MLDLLRGMERTFHHRFMAGSPSAGTVCPVCLCDPDKPDDWHVTWCGHVVCKDCLHQHASIHVFAGLVCICRQFAMPLVVSIEPNSTAEDNVMWAQRSVKSDRRVIWSRNDDHDSNTLLIVGCCLFVSFPGK